MNQNRHGLFSYRGRISRRATLRVLPVGRFISWLLVIWLAAGCVGLPWGGRTSTPTVTDSFTATIPAGLVTADLTATPAAPEGPAILRLWLPPQFDPDSGTAAGGLLKARLAEFSARRPEVRLEVRIKAVEGAGGMLDALAAASAAAPTALPDLLALPRPVMEAAALKGLLRTYDGLPVNLDSTGWYDYARQLAQLQKSTFGIPFAGDGLVLVYRALPEGSIPGRDFGEVLKSGQQLVFPAADPQALFTLALYQALGGSVQDAQGRPILDAALLTEVFMDYQTAVMNGSLPEWVIQMETDEQVWTAFVENRAGMVITWASRYFSLADPIRQESAGAPLPTLGGNAFTLANGWVWALASSQPEKQTLAAELALFLSEDDFLAEWTAAAGYLPTRASVLSAWADTPLKTLAGQAAESAQLFPSADLLSSLGGALRQATLEIISQQGDAQSLALEAAERLHNP